MSRAMKHSGIDWIGEIPKEWKCARLKNLIQCLDSKRIPMEASQRKKGTYPYWGAGSIMDYVDDYIFDEELVLLGEDGAPFFDRKRNVAFYVNEKVWINNHIHVLRPLNGINAHFLTHFLNIVDYKSYINGSILNKLTQSNMNEISCLVLPENEQQKIANYLDKVCGEVDEMIALQEQMIEELKAYKQSVITEAVTKGLNPDVPMKDSGIDWIGEVPEHWKSERLKFLCTIQTGNQDTQDAQQDGDYPFFVRSPKVERSTKFSFEGEGILMAGDGAGAGRVFHHAFGKYAVHQRVYRLSDFSNKIDTNYLFHYISNLFCKVMDMGSAQSTVPSVRLPMLLNFVVCTPPISEQQSIASYLDTKCAEIDTLIAIKQAKMEELKDYKKSVIYEYVTGKKEVNG